MGASCPTLELVLIPVLFFIMNLIVVGVGVYLVKRQANQTIEEMSEISERIRQSRRPRAITPFNEVDVL
jgi:hypothetical protein